MQCRAYTWINFAFILVDIDIVVVGGLHDKNLIECNFFLLIVVLDMGATTKKISYLLFFERKQDFIFTL